MTDDLHDEPKHPTNRQEMIAWIHALIGQLERGEHWRNTKLEDYLEAMASWLEDAHFVYRNVNSEISADTPSWHLMADALAAASDYE